MRNLTDIQARYLAACIKANAAIVSFWASPAQTRYLNGAGACQHRAVSPIYG